jgi:hypothetical protein
MHGVIVSYVADVLGLLASSIYRQQISLKHRATWPKTTPCDNTRTELTPIPKHFPMSQDSAVGIATCYGLDDRGVGVPVPVGSRIFSSLLRPDRLWVCTQLTIQWVPGALSPGVNWSWHESDHSPTSADVKKMWIIRG